MKAEKYLCCKNDDLIWAGEDSSSEWMSLASNNHLWIKDKAHRKGEWQRLLTLRSSRSWHTRLRRAPVSSLLWDCSLSVSPSKRGVATCSLSLFFPLGVSYRWLLVFFSIFSCCHYTSLALPFIASISWREDVWFFPWFQVQSRVGSVSTSVARS